MEEITRSQRYCACQVALALVLCSTTSAAADWADSRQAGPFICRANFRLDGYKILFRQLEQLQNDLTQSLGIAPASEPIEIYLFSDNGVYRRYLRRHLPGIPYRRALFIKQGGPGRVFAHRSPDLAVDIRHECTHALLHASLPMVPLWLDEGLAKYFELPPDHRVFDNPFLRSVRWNAQFGMASRLEDLEKEGDFSKMSRNDYRDAWAWTHFMLHGPPPAHDELVRYLADVQGGTPPGLLSHRLRRRLTDPKRHFLQHFKSWKH
jgi:hypothetical protein